MTSNNSILKNVTFDLSSSLDNHVERAKLTAFVRFWPNDMVQGPYHIRHKSFNRPHKDAAGPRLATS